MRQLPNSERIIRTVCRSHCASACLLKVHVRNGAIIKIEGDDGSEPQFRPCLRGRAYRQRLYSSDRLTVPLRRLRERGEGSFEPITWDEALGTVAHEIQRIGKEYGPAAIILLTSGGDIAWLHNAGLIDRILVRTGGYTGVLGTVSYMGAWLATMANYNAHCETTNNSREDLLNSRLIILWGYNPAVTRGYGEPYWYIAQAKEAGARIVSIDPRYTSSAAVFAHQWVPIRPGTDSAMLIAMAYVIITEHLQNQAFINRYTTGFDKFKDYVLGKQDNIPKTPKWAENITGVPEVATVNLAREYATIKPAALLDGLAPGRTAYGEQFHRVVLTLASMTGNIGIPGGNAGGGFLSTYNPSINLGPIVPLRMGNRENPVDELAPPRRDSVFYRRKDKRGSLTSASFYSGGASSARLNRIRVADAILEGRIGGYPTDYKMLYMMNINYVNQYANTNKIIRALKKLEFIVVHEQFMTATAKFADIILPTNTYMERNDVNTGGIGPFYGYMNKAVDSIGQSRSPFEIASGLAAKLGISDYSRNTEEEWLKEVVESCGDIPDYSDFRNKGVIKINPPRSFISFEKQISDPVNNPFPTPSGRIEIFSQDIADMDNALLPPIPKYIEAWESPNDPLAKNYPLQLITSHPNRRAHTQFDNLPWLRELYPQMVSINSVDARSRGIKAGNMVRIYNDRGQVILPAEVTERIMPGVVDIPQGSWYAPDKEGTDRGGCANVLTSDIVSPGGAFCSNTALVQIEKIK